MSKVPLTWMEKMKIKKDKFMDQASKMGSESLDGVVKSSKSIMNKSKKAVTAASEAWGSQPEPEETPKTKTKG